MQIQPQEYLEKLVEVYQSQCYQYLNERISLQTQLDFALKELEKTETKIKELEAKTKDNEEIENVNQNSDT